MQEVEYVEGAIKTFNTQGNVNDLNHLILGVVSEVGEVIDLFKKHIGYKQEKNDEWLKQLKLELGDCIWYTTILQSYIGKSISILVDGQPPMRFEEMKVSASLMRNSSKLLEYNHSSIEFISSIQQIVVMLNFVAIEHEIEMEDVLIANLIKLQKRHGNKFNALTNLESGRNREDEEV
jgi:NTP pyrophosphatase (non-canonical NTP hydrolase)